MKKCITFCHLLALNAFTLLCCMTWPSFLSAQSGISETSLPLPTQRLIKSMATGPEGYLWFGTQHGLFRYDGHRYVSYTNSTDKTYRISHNEVLDIFPTHDRNLVLLNNLHTVDVLTPSSNELKTIDLGAMTSPRSGIRTGIRESDGRIFFITENDGGYALIEYSMGGFEMLFERKESRRTNPKMTVSGTPRFHLTTQKDGSFIIYDQENGFLLFNERGKLMRRVTSDPLIGKGKPLNFLKKVHDGSILFAFSEEKGVYRLEISSGKIESDSRFDNSFSYSFCEEDEHGNLLLGMCDNDKQITAFLILDSGGRITRIDNPEIRPPTEQIVYGRNFLDFFYTNSTGGLIRIRTGFRQIRSYLSGQNISMRGMIEDNTGNLIFATEWNGLFKLNNLTTEIHPIKINGVNNKDLTPPQYARNLLKDKNGDIWISAYGNPPVTSTPDGYLLRYRPSNGSIKVFKNKYRIEALLISKSGIIYLASNETFQSFNPETEVFRDIPGNYGSLEAGGTIPNCIYQARNGQVWIGTDRGLVQFDSTTSCFRLYGEGSQKENRFTNNNIMAIHEDSNGLLWLGTQGGLHVFNHLTGELILFTTRNGLPDNNICGLLPDNNGGLWISTYKGISYLNQNENRFRNFYTSDGFNHNEFNRHALLRTSDGTYYFGGMDGFNSFKAEDLLKVNSTPAILLSEIAFFDSTGDSLITMSHGLSLFKSVTLPATNRFLLVRFGLDHFSHPELNSYSVFLENYDSDWISQGNISEVRYNNLPPGTYRLHVRGTGPSGALSENSIVLDIYVKEFFYKSGWFYLLLFSIVAGLTTLWIVRLRTEKNRLSVEVDKRTVQIRTDKETIEKQAKELETLDRLKSRFFANISHELRTPLTLILGPLSRLLNKDNLEEPIVRQHLKLMEKNAELLRYQIDELLELSRLDAGKTTLRENPVDVNKVVQEIVGRFRQMAEQKDIDLALSWNLNITEAVMLDKPKFEKILGNLISNAVKFTTIGGVTIQVFQQLMESDNEAEKLLLKIIVSDTGEGISSENLPHIFDRYFQADSSISSAEGTGIGLSIAKEFTELMGGTLSAENQEGTGSTFTLMLPVKVAAKQTKGYEENDTENFQQENLQRADSFSVISMKNKKDFTVLIAEDNTDLRNFLCQILEPLYEVVAVENGKIALEYLTLQKTSLRNLIVLSDVMMPEMDGFTLLDIVRSKETLRRIPFIMLTARAGGENRLRALRMGVDDYLLKPFDEEELLIRITNLLSNLKMRQEVETETVEQDSHETEVPGNWLEFLEQAALESLADPKMGMDFLAEKMNLSRSSLHRRIKAETGLTPNMYIREIRLQEARRLFENALVSSVAEAGQMVGIQKRSYFSKLYSERFGRLPSSYSEDIGSAN